MCVDLPAIIISKDCSFSSRSAPSMPNRHRKLNMSESSEIELT